MVRIALTVLALVTCLAGCGGGGGGGGASAGPVTGGPGPGTPGTTVEVKGVAFAVASSADIESGPLGLAVNASNFTGYDSNAGQSMSTTLGDSTVQGVPCTHLTMSWTGRPGVTWDGLAYDLAVAANGNTYVMRWAVRDTGTTTWRTLYDAATGDPMLANLVFLPATVSVGTSWSFGFTGNTHTVVSMGATSPRLGTTGCILVRASTAAGTLEDYYFKGDLGLVEVNRNPAVATDSDAHVGDFASGLVGAG